MQESSLVKALSKLLEKYYSQEDIHATQDYIYTTGEIPVTLIAHLDTVLARPPQEIYHDPMSGVLWSPNGLGADDRAGVFSIIQLLERGYRPSVIFTTGEEIGGTGATKLTKDFSSPLVETLFLVELDRKGSQDAVYYDCGNRDFESFITSFGFTTQLGSFSDISIIGPAWDRASVNLSIGYVNEHLMTEMLFYRDMFATIERVAQILDNYGNVIYDYQACKNDLFSNSFSANLWICDCCMTPLTDKVEVVEYGLTTIYLCEACAKRHVSKCKKCGREFLNPHLADKTNICEDCKHEYEY